MIPYPLDYCFGRNHVGFDIREYFFLLNARLQPADFPVFFPYCFFQF